MLRLDAMPDGCGLWAVGGGLGWCMALSVEWAVGVGLQEVWHCLAEQLSSLTPAKCE